MLRIFIVSASLIAALVPAPSFAQSAPDFYQGKVLRILVGYAAGGGYDAYARAVAQPLSKYLPGNPTVIVQNMPGADGLAVANYMARIAPHDGTVVAISNRNLAVARLLGLMESSSVQFDPVKFNWLANLNTDISVVIVRSALGIQSVDDLRKRKVAVGSTGQTAGMAIYPNVINNVLGTRLKVISGFAGTNELTLALDQGEIDGIAGWAWSSLQIQRPEWLTDGFIKPILQLGSSSIPGLTNVPLLLDLVKDADEKRALELVIAPDSMGRPFFVPPESPPEAVSLLRAAFAKVVEDQDFQVAAKRARLDVTFTAGTVLQDTVKRLNSTSPQVTEMALQMMREKGKQ